MTRERARFSTLGSVLRERVVLGAAVAAAWLGGSTAALAADPVIEIAAPSDGGAYAAGVPITTSFQCTDEDDDVTNCVATLDGDPTPIRSGKDLTIDDLGPHTLTVTATHDSGPDAVEDATFTIVPVTCADLDATVSRNGTVALEPDCAIAPGEAWEAVTVTAQPPDGEGTVTVDEESGELVYEAPGTDFTGTTTFEYSVHDDDADVDSAPRTVTVEVGPCADVAVGFASFDTVAWTPLEASVDFDCILGADEEIGVTPPPAEAGELLFQPGDLTAIYKPAGVVPTSFEYFVQEAGGGGTPSIPGTVSVVFTPWSPPGGGDGGGDDGGSGGGGGGGRASDGGIVEMPPDEPGPGLPPLPFLPSLNPGGPGSGNIPTSFGRQTGVSLRTKAARADRRGRFAIALRNGNPFAVRAALTVTGAYRSNRKGKRVPSLRVRKPELLLKADGTTRVRLRLGRAARELLAERRRLRVRVTLRVQDVEGARRTVTQRLVLRAPKGARS